MAVFGLRRELDGPVAGRALAKRLLAIAPLFIASALLTLASGGALMVFAGGLSRVPRRILAGALLTLPIFAIGGGLNRPALLKLEAHFAAGGDVPTAEPLIRRFVLAHRLEQALRLAVLALMVLPF